MVLTTLSDHAQLNVVDSGAGRPFLMLHGWAMAGELFRPLMTSYAPGARLVAPDLRGHGASAKYGPATIDRLGQDVVELAAALDLEDVLAVGWSMGAMALWRALEDKTFSARVTGVVVVDMSPKIVNDAAWRLGLRDGRELEETLAAAAAMRRDWPAAVTRFTPNILADGAGPERQGVLDLLREVALGQDAAFLADLWESMAREDFRDRLCVASAPLLAVYGEKSRLYAPASSAFVARRARAGRAVEMRGVGHAPHLEDPQRFAEILTSFAAETSKMKAPAARSGAAM